MTFEVSEAKSQQVTATMSQSISAGATFDYSVSITIFASCATAYVIGTTTMASSAGYTGASIVLRPAISTGRAASVTHSSTYPGAFCTSLISQLTDTAVYSIGTFIRLDDAWISNTSSALVFRFRNTGGISYTATARITATVIP